MRGTGPYEARQPLLLIPVVFRGAEGKGATSCGGYPAER